MVAGRMRIDDSTIVCTSHDARNNKNRKNPITYAILWDPTMREQFKSGKRQTFSAVVEKWRKPQ